MCCKESFITSDMKESVDFCFRVQDDRMIDSRIHKGDIVFVHKQDSVNNGEIAVVILDDTIILVRFYYYEEKKLILLKQDNPKYEDIILTEDEFSKIKIIGKAIVVQSRIESM